MWYTDQVAALDLFVPSSGESFTMSVTTTDMPSGQTAVSAVLVVKTSEGASALITKTVTATPSVSGSIVQSSPGSQAALTFILSSSDTSLLSPLQAYYVYSVYFVTGTPETHFPIPIGRLTVGPTV